MKRFHLIGVAMLSIFLLSGFRSPTGGAGNLVVHLDGLEPHKGLVRVVLYNNAGEFLKEMGFCRADSAWVNSTSMDMTVYNLPYGTYAAAFYQDYNGNGIMDQSWTKIPVEPYAFSNGLHAKWTIPSFESAAFSFGQPVYKIEATLHKWQDW